MPTYCKEDERPGMNMTKRGDWGDLQKRLWILVYRMCTDWLGRKSRKKHCMAAETASNRKTRGQAYSRQFSCLWVKKPVEDNIKKS